MLRSYTRPDDDVVAPEPCCLELRCKSMFYRGDERPGRLHPSDAMDYWCRLTNTKEGPDGSSARHPACQPGRGCFVAPHDVRFDGA